MDKILTQNTNTYHKPRKRQNLNILFFEYIDKKLMLVRMFDIFH